MLIIIGLETVQGNLPEEAIEEGADPEIDSATKIEERADALSVQKKDTKLSSVQIRENTAVVAMTDTTEEEEMTQDQVATTLKQDIDLEEIAEKTDEVGMTEDQEDIAEIEVTLETEGEEETIEEAHQEADRPHRRAVVGTIEAKDIKDRIQDQDQPVSRDLEEGTEVVEEIPQEIAEALPEVVEKTAEINDKAVNLHAVKLEMSLDLDPKVVIPLDQEEDKAQVEVLVPNQELTVI